ncbi:ABC transporter ATP-binding protein [Brevibacillus panacihumi]|uniref:ABC transporter ATP-binding protein n=1 Tax=Brevibacillus panacihumi TaxID=497735 RepID=UPI003CCC6BED
MLTLKDVHTYRSTIHALKGVDLQIDKGSLVAVIGANGAGKSTLLGTIAGQYSPKQGTIYFENKAMEKLPAESVSRMGINLVPERRGMFAELTVEESIRLGAYPRLDSWMIPAKEKRRIEEEMEQMYQLFPRLKERRKQLAGTLSGGEQQMLAIVRGLMAHPRVLLLDEPSLGLAPLIVEEIFDRLYQLKQSDMTIILVEQNAKAALQIADYAYVLENGRIKLEGLPQHLLQDSRIRDAYLSSH